MLVALLGKNAVLIVEFAKQKQAQGMPVLDAAIEGAKVRFRPILMTSLTLILAMMMPALGIGSGVELSQPLAIAIVGGMISSTFLTLVFKNLPPFLRNKSKNFNNIFFGFLACLA